MKAKKIDLFIFYTKASPNCFVVQTKNQSPDECCNSGEWKQKQVEILTSCKTTTDFIFNRVGEN